MSADGAVRFARFAHPPNDLGYCGPQADGTLLRVAGGAGGAGGADGDGNGDGDGDASGDADGDGPGDGELTRVARHFEGAWPYLELIAAGAGVADPLDAAVVDAYWLGNRLSGMVEPASFEADLRSAVDGRIGVPWADVAAAIADGGLPTHAFHVLSVSPWVPLLARGAVSEALRVLDGCRIGWGEVQRADGDRALVRRRPLVWEGGALGLGAPSDQWLRSGADGLALSGSLSPGDVVATHWDWVCEVLAPGRVEGLQTATHQQLELVERRLRRLDPG